MLAYQPQHLTFRLILCVYKISISIIELKLEAAKVKTIAWPLLILQNEKNKIVLIMESVDICTYSFKDCANLQCAEGLHDFVRARILHAELKGQLTAFFD